MKIKDLVEQKETSESEFLAAILIPLKNCLEDGDWTQDNMDGAEDQDNLDIDTIVSNKNNQKDLELVLGHSQGEGYYESFGELTIGNNSITFEDDTAGAPDAISLALPRAKLKQVLEKIEKLVNKLNLSGVKIAASSDYYNEKDDEHGTTRASKGDFYISFLASLKSRE